MDASPKQQIGIFLGLTFSLTFLVEWYCVKAVGMGIGALTLPLCWIPGALAVACSSYFQNPASELGLRPPSLPKYWFIAYAVPAALAVLIALLAVVSGLSAFAFHGTRPLLRATIFAPTLGVLTAFLSALGLEIAWRGFLLARLKEAEIAVPHFIAAAAGAIWLLPLYVWGTAEPSRLPALSVMLFTVSTVSCAISLGWLRERSRSVLVPALAFAAHVTWVNDIVPAFLKAGPFTAFFVGEAGILTAIAYVVLAGYLVRREENFLQV